MSDNFQWTDELVKEFTKEYHSTDTWITVADPIIKKLEHFKASKSKPVLFTTEDGKHIYEGDDYWFIRHDDTIGTANSSRPPLPKGKATFSTEAVAKEYVLMNKPCLSVNDIISICADDQDTLSTRRMHLLNTAKLKQQP
jgi:hypothetical protein